MSQQAMIMYRKQLFEANTLIRGLEAEKENLETIVSNLRKDVKLLEKELKELKKAGKSK